MRNHTKKAKTNKNPKKNFNNRNALNIPELKHAWDQIRSETTRILKEATSSDKQVKEFQAVWKKIFQRPVSTESAEAYLKIKRFSTERPAQKKTRKMKGGAAPIDSTLQPGVYGPHGSFPSYQSQGLGFYDSINKQGLYQDCGVKDISPILQKGGTLSDASVLTAYSPITSSSPPSHLQTVQNNLKGFESPSHMSDPTVNPGILRA
jgi:hypothetical protein